MLRKSEKDPSNYYFFYFSELHHPLERIVENSERHKMKPNKIDILCLCFILNAPDKGKCLHHRCNVL